MRALVRVAYCVSLIPDPVSRFTVHGSPAGVITAWARAKLSRRGSVAEACWTGAVKVRTTSGVLAVRAAGMSTVYGVQPGPTVNVASRVSPLRTSTGRG